MSTEATAEPTGSDPILGKLIDGCRIQRKLGQGGMGVVYLAEHETLHQPFVIKILNPALVGAEDTVDRFFREAQACAQLNHPGIVGIQNVGQEGEYYFIRMEYVEGDTLEETIRKSDQLDWREAARMIIETAEALSHAHQKGMIHRDIKPENIMITPGGAVKVMDFGLAKHVHSSTKVSVTGQIVGTPFFMSPEQAGGKPTDARSDIYSLGVTLYYMVTKVKPFNGKNLQEIFLKHFFYAPESPKIYNATLPESLCEVVRRCLKKKKKERYQSARALIKDLQQILADPDAPLGEGADPAASASGDDEAEMGKTVRADAGAADGGDGHTVRVDVGEDPGGATVRVAQTVDVAPTVAVKGKAKGRGEVGTVSFGQDGDGGVTVRVGGEATVKAAATDDDEEHPAAGLDLPTAMIAGVTGGPATEEKRPAAPGRPQRSRKVALVVAALVLGPLVAVGAFEMRARGRFNELKDRYDTETQAPDEGKDPMRLRELADDLETIGRSSLSRKTEAEAMARFSRNLADSVERERAAAAERLRLQREEEERNRAAVEERKRREAEATKALGELAALREAKSWREYTARALTLLKEVGAIDATAKIRLPVLVSSAPAGASVHLDEPGDADERLTPAVVWVRPNRPFTLKIRKRGFDEATFTADATGLIEHEARLVRTKLRELSLGELPVLLGPRPRPEPLVMAAPPALDQAQGGTIYYVTQAGQVVARGLRRGQPEWSFQAQEHQVGEYGDPTPAVLVVPGQAVFVSSLLGRLTAHRPGTDGARIWTAEVGAPVTSSPAYEGAHRVVAVGTAAGEVVVIDGRSGKVTWRFPAENMVVATPLFQGERLFVASTDDRLYALDWSAKRLLGTLDLGGDLVQGPLPVGGQLVAVRRDGAVLLVDASTPAAMTFRALTGGRSDEPLGQHQGVEVSGADVFVSNGRTLEAFEVTAQGPRARWKAPFACPSGTVTRPFVRGDVLYVASSGGVVYALERASGEVRWTFTIPDGQVTLPPFAVDDDLFVVDRARVFVLFAD